ncbi:ribonuclease P protein subunit p14-like [Diadema antillarum]
MMDKNPKYDEESSWRRKGNTEYMYMDISLEFEGTPPEIEDAVFKYILTLALRQLHGDIGAAMTLDLLRYQPDDLRAILRFHHSGLVKLWSALTMYGYYNDRRCVFIVHKVSPHLSSLAVDSRQGVLELLSGCG